MAKVPQLNTREFMKKNINYFSDDTKMVKRESRVKTILSTSAKWSLKHSQGRVYVA